MGSGLGRDTSFARLYRLLAHDVRPQLCRLALVMLLSSVVAFGEKAPLLLIKPLFDRVLFPQSAVEREDENPALRA